MPSRDPHRRDQRSYRNAFRSADYRRYFPAGVFSTLGSWTLRFLLGWSAWELTASATWVGAVAGLMLAPALVLSPVFGIVADRVNPRNGLLITVILQGAVAAAAATAMLLDLYALPALLLFATALGVATSAHTPLRLALVPALVPRESLPSAIGFSAITFNTSRILGPALGAWLLSVAHAEAAFIAAALLMFCALPFLMIISGAPRGPESAAHDRFLVQLADGWHYTRRHAPIRLVFGFTLVNALLGRTVIELLPALSGQLLSGGPTTLATLTAGAGLGSILGGLLVSRQGSGEERLLRLLGGALATGAILVAGLGYASSLQAVVVVIALVSLITTVAGTTSQALAQLLVDDAYRGRVLSLWTMLAMGAPALGALAMGWLADRYSFPPALLCFAVLSMLMLVWLYSRRRKLRADSAG
ncbi:MFS transporter [Pseudohalioglobus sediminis]|uniref:MFS transporter n=1 Tax=Pseudohalioglobus sediminis TaxID=2606449 RepID=A0A5B0X192_9GAMM|nr:MFS transporter [Pseudohalioglobus sediminis]